MRVISGRLPEGVIGGGIYYPIRTDFKVWLRFAAALEEADYTGALRLCYIDKIPPDTAEAFELLCGFFSGKVKRGGAVSGERVFSFAEDEELIYASFMAYYGIDLAAVDMHWWRFAALLRSLPPEAPLMRAVKIRSVRLSDVKDAPMRRRIAAQKRIWGLEGERKAEVADVVSAAFAADTGGEKNG